MDEASGLSAARLSALSVLVFGGPTTVGALARAEQVSAPTMSRLVSGLERDGFVVREAAEDDARAVRVRATPKGRRVLVQGRERRVTELVQLLEASRPTSCGRSARPPRSWSESCETVAVRPRPTRMLNVPRKGGGPFE